MAYTLTFGITLGSTDTGLTADLRAQLVDTAAVDVGGVISTGFVEVGGGNYLLTTSVPSGHRGGIKFYSQSSGDILAFSAINPEDDEYKVLIKAKTDTLGAGQVAVTSPVAASGAVTIYAGYDMSAVDGLAIDFADPGNWPDLTGADVFLSGQFTRGFMVAGSAPLTVEGTVLGEGGPDQVVRFEPAAADTAELEETNRWRYDVYAVLVSGEMRPLVKDGQLTITKKLD